MNESSSSDEDSFDQTELEVALYSQIHFESVEQDLIHQHDDILAPVYNDGFKNREVTVLEHSKKTRKDLSLKSLSSSHSNSRSKKYDLEISKTDKNINSKDAITSNEGFIKLSAGSPESQNLSEFEESEQTLDSSSFFYKPETKDVVYKFSDTDDDDFTQEKLKSKYDTCKVTGNKGTPFYKEVEDYQNKSDHVSTEKEKEEDNVSNSEEEDESLSAKRLAIMKALEEVPLSSGEDSQKEKGEFTDELTKDDGSVKDVESENESVSDSDSDSSSNNSDISDQNLEFNLEGDGKNLLKESKPSKFKFIVLILIIKTNSRPFYLC